MTKFKKKRLSIDERIENAKFDFCKNLKWFLIAPVIIAIVGVILLSTIGFKLGIDFTGGTTMTVAVEGSNYSLDNTAKVEYAINDVLDEYGLSVDTLQKTEMGGVDAVLIKFQNNNNLETEKIEQINEEIRAKLLVKFGYAQESEFDFENLDFENVTNAEKVNLGGVTTASASSELMMKSSIALLVAVVVIMIYVAFRFELTSGLAAILALFHDVIVTASVVLMCRIEINVSFIAALITILGYSINNTIVIFDRMRDEVKMRKGTKFDNAQIANIGVKTTLTRSVLTTLTTFVTIFMITIIGVADIREFAFPIMIGILSGFYSSVFLTPGLWAIAYRPKRRKKTTQNTKQNSKNAYEQDVEVVDAK